MLECSMTNFDFLKKYEELQYTIMFDRFVDLGFATVSYCEGDNSPFWNHALTDQVIDDGQLSEIEKTLTSLKRKPAVYFENKPILEPLKKSLENKKYKKTAEDSWMFFGQDTIDASKFDSIIKVQNEDELRVYLETFDLCYQKDDPQNVYGGLGEYLSVAEKAWKRHYNSDRIEYFIVYDKDEPVAVSALTNLNGIGYISNVGSLRKVRGRGFGKTATLFCVQESINKRNKLHCLATEENTYPNEFYKRIGFKTRSTANLFVK